MPTAEEIAAARAAARGFDERHEVEARCAALADLRMTTAEPPASRQVLYLDDFSAIPFLSGIAGVELYQHRARVRAHDRSIFAAVTTPVEGYETYCREKLFFGEPEFVQAEAEGGDLLQVARSCMHGEAFDRIVGRAKQAGGLVIHPYMGIQAVWDLARAVNERASVPVSVIGPAPVVTWVANDKAALHELTVEAAGEDVMVRTECERAPEAIARQLRNLSKLAGRVGLKRTRCASAMGNRVFDSSEVGGLSEEDLVASVQAFLDETEWDGEEEVLIVVWEQSDCSPSTQLWIPPVETGRLPVVDGVYEQILEGDHKVFVGSRPSTLPEDLNQRLSHVSLLVAIALQELGYVGRCSFDFVVTSQGVKLTECNGRWGGTSTPMSMVDRLTGPPRPMYRAQDVVHPGLIGASFSEILARAESELFDAKTNEGRFVFYNVGPLDRFGKLDVIAFGDSKEAADEAMNEHLPRLLGIS